LTGLAPWLRPYGEWLLQQAGGPVTVTSVYRSYSEQLHLWLNRSRNPYPVAPPGRSYHQYGRAFDLAASPAELHRLGAIWRAIGGTWSPSDAIHFQA
jgi:uncharacterized protein YcbK (DUF882 family)